MKVLVLGGQGFIGSHISEALLAEGYDVKTFSRQSIRVVSGVECFVGDFLDKAKVAEALTGVDVVVHCISSTVPATSASNPVFDIETNLIGTVELMRLMHTQGIQRLIYLSSGGTVYGNSANSPVNEQQPLNPISSYGAVKVAIEKFIDVAEENWGIHPVVLRPSNPYGERQGHKGVQGLISTLLHNAMNDEVTTVYGDGSTVRDYIYVRDIADLVVRTISNDRVGIYNAGSGEGRSVNQVIYSVEEATGLEIRRKYIEMRGFDVKEIVLDNTLAIEHFGWSPSIPLLSGIRRQYKWLKEVHGSAD